MPKAERQKAIIEIEATPIVFFGRVVDQHDQPVVGARISYTVHHLTFAGNPVIEGPTTDSAGTFEIRTRGPSITVAVAHPEYYHGKEAERQIDYASSAADRDRSAPTRETPALFRLVKKGQTEMIVHVQSKQIRLPLDGRPVEISLGENSINIIARLYSTGASSDPNEFRRFDWTLVIAVPNGGLAERRNPP